MCCAADNHNYICHTCAKEFLRFQLQLSSYWQNITFSQNCPKFRIFTKIVFHGSDMSGILFFIFASCELLSLYMLMSSTDDWLKFPNFFPRFSKFMFSLFVVVKSMYKTSRRNRFEPSPLLQLFQILGEVGNVAQWIEHQTLNTWITARRGLESDWCQKFVWASCAPEHSTVIVPWFGGSSLSSSSFIHHQLKKKKKKTCSREKNTEERW